MESTKLTSFVLKNILKFIKHWNQNGQTNSYNEHLSQNAKMRNELLDIKYTIISIHFMFDTRIFYSQRLRIAFVTIQKKVFILLFESF